MKHRWILICGAGLAFLAVMAGAFAAHGLESSLGAYGADVFRTAAQYQMYHALGLILIAVMVQMHSLSTKLLLAVAMMFVLGILVFCGSLYVLALTGAKWLGAVTPVGGLAFLAGWVTLVLAAIKKRNADPQ